MKRASPRSRVTNKGEHHRFSTENPKDGSTLRQRLCDKVEIRHKYTSLYTYTYTAAGASGSSTKDTANPIATSLHPRAPATLYTLTDAPNDVHSTITGWGCWYTSGSDGAMSRGRGSASVVVGVGVGTSLVVLAWPRVTVRAGKWGTTARVSHPLFSARRHSELLV